MTKLVFGAALAAASLTIMATSAAAQQPSGKPLFDRWCSGCHEPIVAGRPGSGMEPPAGTYTLQQRYQGSVPAALEERTDLTPEFVKGMVRSGMNVMPPTRKTELTDAELDSLAAYLTRNAKK